MGLIEYYEHTDEGETVWWNNTPEFREWLLGQMKWPIIVEPGGDRYYLGPYTGPGSLIIAQPGDSENFYWHKGENYFFMHGGYDNVHLPKDTADIVMLNMVVSAIVGGNPTQIVLDTIEMARRIASPGATLQILDGTTTLSTPVSELAKQGIPHEFRRLDMNDRVDRALCEHRSHDYAYLSDDLSLLVVPL
ncbi:MAG: hypothetical protein AAB800_00620 [Patescibacteria group bacterium]